MKIELSQMGEKDQLLRLVLPPSEGWWSGLLDHLEPASRGQMEPLEVEVSRLSEEFLVRGEMVCQVHSPCVRCLEEGTVEIRAPFAYLFRKGAQEVPIETEDGPLRVEGEVFPFNGQTIELGDLLRELLLVNIPIQVLCCSECKGLCAGCGANLNEEPCRCEGAREDSPFAALKKIQL